MAALKTRKNTNSVKDFIAAVDHEQRRQDSRVLLKLFREVTGKRPRMWGDSIIGFGEYHYKSERSRQEGDWPLTGFSPRKRAMTIYIMPGFSDYGDLLDKLGKYKHSVSCLYVSRLDDIDLRVLKQLIRRSVADMRKKYVVK